MNKSQMSLNSITVKSANFQELVELAAKHEIGGIAPWRDLLDGISLSKARVKLDNEGLRVSSLCRGGMFTAPDEASRQAAIEDNKSAIEQAAALGAETLVLVCGPVINGDVGGSQRMIFDGISAITDTARDAGVRLSIEPLHPMMASSRSAITLISQSLQMVRELNCASVGICVDAYHVWWDPDLSQWLREAGQAIQAFHVSDWVTPIMGELSSRGLMGDGCINLKGMREDIYSAGYSGLTEVEILSDYWWSMPPAELVPVLVERFEEHV